MNPALPSPAASHLIVYAISGGALAMFVGILVVVAAAWLLRGLKAASVRRSRRAVYTAFPGAYDLAPMGAAGRKDDSALPLLERDSASRVAAMRRMVEDAHDAMRAEQALARFDRRQSASVPVPDALLEAGSECQREPEQDVA